MDEMIKDAPLPQAASNQWAAPEAGAVSATRPKRDLCPLLMALVACAILLYTAGCIFVGSCDNDVWFILATGSTSSLTAFPTRTRSPSSPILASWLSSDSIA